MEEQQKQGDIQSLANKLAAFSKGLTPGEQALLIDAMKRSLPDADVQGFGAGGLLLERPAIYMDWLNSLASLSIKGKEGITTTHGNGSLVRAARDIARRIFEEAWNQGNVAVVDELFAASYVGNAPTMTIQGPEGYKQLISVCRTAVPDLRFNIEFQISEGDMVMTRWTASGTHQRDLQGIPPTGKQMTVTGVDVFRIADGKIVEGWTNWDAFGLLHQLGMIPSMVRVASLGA